MSLFKTTGNDFIWKFCIAKLRCKNNLHLSSWPIFIVTKVCGCRDLQCRQVKFTQVKLQKLATQVGLESTINPVIEGIYVHRSVKLFLVLLRGASCGPAKFVHGTYPACKALAVSLQNPCGVLYPPRSLLVGPRSILAGVWNYLWPVLYMYWGS